MNDETNTTPRLIDPLVWGLSVLIAILVALWFTVAALDRTDGTLIMPLDDVYIHFQYARQFTLGNWYSYNSGLGATSGATSFLYPYLLAVGYGAGFQGLQLGYWAIALGTVALTGTLAAVGTLIQQWGGQRWVALGVMVTLGLSGSLTWHFISGMETGLLVLFSVWALVWFSRGDAGRLIIIATLLTLTRPEGGLLSFVLVILYGAIHWRRLRRRVVLLTLPILALAVQPLVNALVTGNAVASGNQSKSLLGMVPFDLLTVLQRIVEQFGRIWLELFIGQSPIHGWMLAPGLLILAIAGLIMMAVSRRYRPMAILLIIWALILTASVATLDTAFWHFKRYQVPLMIWLFPLAGVALSRVAMRWWMVTAVILGLLVGFGAIVSEQFRTYHRENVGYVYDQPYQMARWLADNTPEDSVIAVHDVGMMRYIGDRTTLDIVGLTTPGAAAYWRNGPGSVGEFILGEQPDYIASYGRGHGYGLGMLAETALYANPLATFSVDLQPHMNVALAADTQAIYALDWGVESSAINVPETDQMAITRTIDINVADIESETAVNYAWDSDDQLIGFPTEFHQFGDRMDGVRAITADETFTLRGIVDQDLLLVTRVHPLTSGTLRVYANDVLVTENVIPEIPGTWLTIPALIRDEAIQGDQVTVRIVPDGIYYPAMHTVFVGEYAMDNAPEPTIATYQGGALRLTDYAVTLTDHQMEIDLNWYATDDVQGDYRLFVHLYDDLNAEPIAQFDGYAGNGQRPIGNWLEGVRRDTISVNLDTVSSGVFQLAIGFYDPTTGERLDPLPQENLSVRDRRLLLDEVEVNRDGG